MNRSDPTYEVALDRFDGWTQVLGLSVDSVPCLQAWAESLTGITYPLMSDFFPHGKVAQTYGVLRSEGYSERALFIIDKQGVIRYIDVHDIDHQPDNEVLFAELEKLEPYYAAQYAARIAAKKKPEPQTPTNPATDVMLYCTPWCPACRRAGHSCARTRSLSTRSISCKIALRQLRCVNGPADEDYADPQCAWNNRDRV